MSQVEHRLGPLCRSARSGTAHILFRSQVYPAIKILKVIFEIEVSALGDRHCALCSTRSGRWCFVVVDRWVGWGGRRSGVGLVH